MAFNETAIYPSETLADGHYDGHCHYDGREHSILMDIMIDIK